MPKDEKDDNMDPFRKACADASDEQLDAMGIVLSDEIARRGVAKNKKDQPVAAARATSRDKFDTSVALAKQAGCRVELSADGRKATIHPTGAQRAAGRTAPIVLEMGRE